MTPTIWGVRPSSTLVGRGMTRTISVRNLGSGSTLREVLQPEHVALVRSVDARMGPLQLGHVGREGPRFHSTLRPGRSSLPDSVTPLPSRSIAPSAELRAADHASASMAVSCRQLPHVVRSSGLLTGACAAQLPHSISSWTPTNSPDFFMRVPPSMPETIALAHPFVTGSESESKSESESESRRNRGVRRLPLSPSDVRCTPCAERTTSWRAGYTQGRFWPENTASMRSSARAVWASSRAPRSSAWVVSSP